MKTTRLFTTTRRNVLKASAAGLLAAGARPARADADKKPSTYADHATGIRILPGAWRPHYYWEHIAWVSPSWPSQDYIWLDFPEAIFTEADRALYSAKESGKD